MSETISISTPLKVEELRKLKAGDFVNISGIVYAARDAVHKKLIEIISAGKNLPFNIKQQVIYYVGPCPAKPGYVIGSAGPTTSGRMDLYTPPLIKAGLTGMIGKGQRNNEVVKAMIDYGAVYFGAVGGTGALLAKSIIKQEIIAFPELGTEALRKLEIDRFPAIVAIDSYGNSLYDTGRKKYYIE
jgi:fumarate hydratase subunit beta